MILPHQFVWICGSGLIAGVILGSRLELPIVILISALCLFGLSLLFRPKPLSVVVSLFCLALLFGWWHGQSAFRYPSWVVNFDQRLVAVEGAVVNDPEVLGNQQKFFLGTTTIDEEAYRTKILVTAWHLPAVQYQDRWSGKLELALPKNSEDFKYANYLVKDGIYLVGTQAGKFEVVSSSRPTILGTLFVVKHWVYQAIHRFLPEPHAGLLAGLLLGIKADLSEEFKTALQASGTSHVVALSGFNLTIIISFMLFMLRLLPRRLVWLISGLAILGFIIMTGAASSVVRAGIMGWTLLLSGFWGRQHYPVNAVIIAGVMMVMLHPLILFYDIGFQLSLAATIGLISMTPLITPIVKKLPAVIGESLSATIGATIFTLPLIAFYFGGISWVTLGANLLVVPLIPYVMLFSGIGLLAFILVPKLLWINIFVWPLLALLAGIINWFGHLPSALLQLPPLPVWVPVGYYFALILVLIYVHTRSSSKLVH